MRILTGSCLVLATMVAWSSSLTCQRTEQRRETVSQLSTSHCPVRRESFALRDQELAVFSIPAREQLLTSVESSARDARAVFFDAGMTIDADGAPNAYGPHNRGLDYSANARSSQDQRWVAVVTDQYGKPVIQRSGRYRGYYVSITSLTQPGIKETNPHKYIDATRIPYIALPPDFAAEYGVSLGDLVVATNMANGRSAYAIFADVGPKGRIGEGSIALARQLGIPSDPRHDSVASGVRYLIFPGSALPAGTRITASKVRASAARLFRSWGGAKRLRACAPSRSQTSPAGIAKAN